MPALSRMLNLDSGIDTDFKVLIDVSMFYMALLCLELDTTFFINSFSKCYWCHTLSINFSKPIINLVNFFLLLSCI